MRYSPCHFSSHRYGDGWGKGSYLQIIGAYENKIFTNWVISGTMDNYVLSRTSKVLPITRSVQPY